MTQNKKREFSNEIIEFSKIIDETFSNVSKDAKQLFELHTKVNKVNKSDLDKIKKDIIELKTSISSLKGLLNEVTIKVKRRPIVESVKPINNKKEITELKSEIIKIQDRIKNIEIKLKMD